MVEQLKLVWMAATKVERVVIFVMCGLILFDLVTFAWVRALAMCFVLAWILWSINSDL